MLAKKDRVAVFLDTNIFISECFNFREGKDLYRLKNLVEFGDIAIFLDNIVVREAEAHIKLEVARSANILKNIGKQKLSELNRNVKEGLTILENIDEHKSFLENIYKLNKKKMIEDAIGEFRGYLYDTKAKILKNSNVNIEEILDDYFLEKPPFQNSNNKKAEFPDAIMVKRLKELADEECRIIIISNDKGFVRAIDDMEMDAFYVLDEVGELLNEFNMENKEEVSRKIIKYLNEEETKEEVVSLIEAAIYEKEIYVDGFEYDRKGIIGGYEYEEAMVNKVENIKLGKICIKRLDEYVAELVIDSNAEIVIEATYFDEEASIWDSEEKAYLYPHYGEVREEHSVNFECEALLDIRNMDMMKIKDIDFNIELNTGTRKMCMDISPNPWYFADDEDK